MQVTHWYGKTCEGSMWINDVWEHYTELTVPWIYCVLHRHMPSWSFSLFHSIGYQRIHFIFYVSETFNFIFTFKIFYFYIFQYSFCITLYLQSPTQHPKIESPFFPISIITYFTPIAFRYLLVCLHLLVCKPSVCYSFFFFFLNGCFCGLWKFLGQGSNQSYS